jgi:hypothetical protein
MENQVEEVVSTPVEAPKVEVETKSEPKELNQNEMSFRDALKQNMAEDKKVEKKEASEDRPKQPNQYTKKAEPETSTKLPPPVAPPADMTAEELEDFKALTPKQQAYVSRRAYETRSAFSRSMQEVQQKAKSYEGIEREIAPHRPWLATKGITEDAVIRNAIGWEQRLEQDRLGGAKAWLQAQGIDPYELLDENSQYEQPQQARQIDPEEVERNIFNKIQNQFQLQEQARTTEQHYNVVEKFKNDKVLFQDPNTASMLESEMAPLISLYVQQDPSLPPEKALEKAYTTVTRSNDTFANLLNAYGERERAEKAKAEAEKARQASRSISGGLSGSNPVTTGLGFRDELRLRMKGAL